MAQQSKKTIEPRFFLLLIRPWNNPDSKSEESQGPLRIQHTM
jgi:hypothetical protein